MFKSSSFKFSRSKTVITKTVSFTEEVNIIDTLDKTVNLSSTVELPKIVDLPRTLSLNYVNDKKQVSQFISLIVELLDSENVYNKMLHTKGVPELLKVFMMYKRPLCLIDYCVR